MSDHLDPDLIIHHADCPDGFCSAWLAGVATGCVHRLPARHGDAPPDVAGLRVLVADFSYRRDVLDRMNEEAAALLVLDHHATARDALHGAPYARFDLGRSGAGLVRDYYRDAIDSRLDWIADAVEARDLLRPCSPAEDAVAEYLYSLPRDSPEAYAAWGRAADLGHDSALLQGRVMVLCRDAYVERAAAAAGEAEFTDGDEALRLPIVNAPVQWVSHLLQRLASEHPSGRAAAWRQDADGRVSLSLRGTPGNPVRRIAEGLGGGGHDLAAGARASLEDVARWLKR